MRRAVGVVLSLMIMALPVWGDAKEENKRLEESGQVLSDILGIPDNIPQELLDKAECVIVLPSVKKFAIGFGGR